MNKGMHGGMNSGGMNHRAAASERAGTNRQAGGDDPLHWPATLLDVADVEVPEPMVCILDALETLPERGCLRVLIDREPHPLYRVLDRYELLHRTAPTGDGRYEMLIWQLPLTDAA